MSSDVDAFDVPQALFAAPDIASRRRIAEEDKTKQSLDALQHYTETLPALTNRLLAISSNAERKSAIAASAFVPIHTLTPELMGYCFSVGIPNDIASRPSYARTLCQVCGDWRAVAINCSELWTTMVGTWNEEYAETCALRAKGRPLDIIMGIKARHRWSLHHWILSGGVTPFQQWRSLDLEAHRSHSIWEVFREMIPHLAHLRFLRFRLPPGTPAQGTPLNSLRDATPLIELLPNVRSINLRTLTAPLSFVIGPDLTDIRLEIRVSHAIVTHILDVCTSLEQLRVLGGISYKAGAIVDPTYGVSAFTTEVLEASLSLHTFVAAELHPLDALYVVSNLNAPGLLHLALFATTSRDSDLSFIETKWDVDMPEDMPAEILMLLFRLPELRSISLKMSIEVIEHFASGISRSSDVLALNLVDIALATATEGRAIQAQHSRSDTVKPIPVLYPCIKEDLEVFLVTRASGSATGKALKRISLDALDDLDVVELEQIVWQVYVDPEPIRRWL